MARRLPATLRLRQAPPACGMYPEAPCLMLCPVHIPRARPAKDVLRCQFYNEMLVLAPVNCGRADEDSLNSPVAVACVRRTPARTSAALECRHVSLRPGLQGGHQVFLRMLETCSPSGSVFYLRGNTKKLCTRACEQV